jgi:hypothetical protein
LLLITFEKWSKLGESSIRHVIEPTLDKDAIIWLKLEILCHVINNDGAGEVTPNATQIFYENRAVR